MSRAEVAKLLPFWPSASVQILVEKKYFGQSELLYPGESKADQVLKCTSVKSKHDEDFLPRSVKEIVYLKEMQKL